MWNEAANIQLYPVDLPWQKFPWQKAIIHFAKLMGSARSGKLELARAELKNLIHIYDTLSAQKDIYKANQVMIQIKTGEAWILFREKKTNEAMQVMTEAAAMENKTEKTSVTPGEVLPAQELLAEMLLLSNKAAEALTAYEVDLKKRPNRFNALFGAASAAEQLKDNEKAISYYQQLLAMVGSAKTNRHEVETAKLFLTKVKRSTSNLMN